MDKFAIVSHVFPPSWSGQSVVLGRLLKDIDPESYILISSKKNDIKNKNTDIDISGKHFLAKSLYSSSNKNPYHGFRVLLLPIELIIRSTQIIKIVRNEKCNCIIACSGDLLNIPCAYFAGKFSNHKVIPYYFDDFVFQWANPIARYFAKIIEKLVFKRNTQVIVPNEFMKEVIEQRQHINSTIIRNPINPDSDRNKPNKNISTDETHIVFTGAIYHVNLAAFRTLIAAMDILSETRIGLNLYTAQSVHFLKSENILGKNINLFSHASAKEIAVNQQQADILFIPFSFDSILSEVIRSSSPGKLADYLSSGVPILAFVPPDSFVAWFLKKHQCGFVVDKNDPLELAKGIQELINNDQLRKIIVQNAIKIAANEFDYHKASKTFLEVISKTHENL